MTSPEPPESISNFYEQISDKIISPVKQGLGDFPEKVKESIGQVMKKFQNKAGQKKEEVKEEIKEEIKEESKEQIRKKSKWAGDKIKSWLAPLKIKIQQGSEIIRRWVERMKEKYSD